MTGSPQIGGFIRKWVEFEFADLSARPWDVTSSASAIVQTAIESIGHDYRVVGSVAIHKSAEIEGGAVIKGPCIIGPNVLIAANAYLRGGVFVDAECIVGPCCELKSVFMFGGSKVAHLSFIGDSLLGSGVNIEAGAIIANYRNERDDKAISIGWRGQTICTGVEKFGALVGDYARIGANAVVAPGALIEPNAIIGRLELVDQSTT